MADKNTYITQMAAAQVSPITFAAINSAATARTAIDLVIALLSREGMNIDEPRNFADEMSPAARITMVSIMTAMRAAAV